MSDRARAWLATRAGAVPPALEARMESAMDDVVGQDTVPAALAAAARVCMRDALAAGDDRSAAVHLLAADALITYACEAAADGRDAEFDVVARAAAPERLALLLDTDGPS
ncbi:MAG TPA: hypothetical protein VK912_11540 [Longimicrobiales bacterium]|nr:hypothetical protein [Longimicrobiales bacterium]